MKRFGLLILFSSMLHLSMFVTVTNYNLCFCKLLYEFRSGEWGDHLTLQAAADRVILNYSQFPDLEQANTHMVRTTCHHLKIYIF